MTKQITFCTYINNFHTYKTPKLHDFPLASNTFGHCPLAETRPLALLTSHHPDCLKTLAISSILLQASPSLPTLKRQRAPHLLPCHYSLLTLRALIGHLIHSLDF